METATLLNDLAPDAADRHFERLMTALSSRFASLHKHGLADTVAHALEQVCACFQVERAALIEFDEDMDVRASHWPGQPSSPPTVLDAPPVSCAWLLDQLREQRTVAITSDDDLPVHATAEREFARRNNISSLLAVPIAIAGTQIGALVLATRQRLRDWPVTVQDRTRMIGEIIGSALQRDRHEEALRANLHEIERLNKRLTVDNICLKEDIKTVHDFEEIVGGSDVMRVALERVQQVAPINCSVLLMGETGTGKELFARALHERSRRSSRALVRVNCAALPPTLMESELFGHEKGAFTGAVSMRQGRFELADGGTIFLDEIGDLPLEMQGKLLRVLQEGEFERVGSSRTRTVDVRVIAASHHNLHQLVQDKQFRADLYYRLSVFPINVPALRDRREDIPSLVWFFINRHQREFGRKITRIPAPVMSALIEYDWPGNVRELENVVERGMIRSIDEMFQLDGTLGVSSRERTLSSSASLDDMQRWHIENTLRQCGWRINGRGNAAERLALHPNTLRFRMKKLGIRSPREMGAMR